MIRMPHAPMHLGCTLVAAMKDTLEMEGIALVSCVMTMIIVYFLFVLFKVCALVTDLNMFAIKQSWKCCFVFEGLGEGAG